MRDSKTAVTRRPGDGQGREDGIAAIEFAFVGPILFLLLGCTFEVAVMLAAEFSLQDAVQNSSRLIRTGQYTAANSTLETFRTQICNRATMLKNCETSLKLNVSNATNFSGLTVPALSTITNGYSPGAGKSAVVVLATYDWTFVLPTMAPFANLPGGKVRRLDGMAVFQNEPF